MYNAHIRIMLIYLCILEDTCTSITFIKISFIYKKTKTKSKNNWVECLLYHHKIGKSKIRD